MRFVCGRPSFSSADTDALVSCVRSGWVGCGPENARLEQELAALYGSDEAVTFSSATAGLVAALFLAGAKPGTEVIVPSFTYCGVLNAVWALGSTPVLVDCTPCGTSLCLESTKMAMSDRTVAIVAMSWRGAPPDTRGLLEIAEEHRARLVLDGAYALGTKFEHEDVCTPSCPMVVSFHPTKIITAGLGGALIGLTSDDAAAVRRIRGQGIHPASWTRHSGSGVVDYRQLHRGFALEMSDIHAALARSQLTRLDSEIARRRALVSRATENLRGVVELLPNVAGDVRGRSNASLLAFKLPEGTDRDAFRLHMLQSGFHSAVHYPAVHLQPAACDVPFFSVRNEESHAAELGRLVVSLPSEPRMSDSDVESMTTAASRALTLAS